MCRPVTCSTCGKTTWAGCGDHVAQVKATVPADQWCGGHGDAVEPTVKAGSGLFKIFGR
ncbi:MAG TPA: hypothetical protein VGK18_03420 [Propionicimonas sp.]|jgi:hypothetical protein|uniref:hypothetical protein n=1 Tax=Propionicimonas sp. TaxID=1955623 RepID=UPI002F405461